MAAGGGGGGGSHTSDILRSDGFPADAGESCEDARYSSSILADSKQGGRVRKVEKMTFKTALGVSSSAGGGKQIFTPDFLAVGRLFPPTAVPLCYWSAAKGDRKHF